MNDSEMGKPAAVRRLTTARDVLKRRESRDSAEIALYTFRTGLSLGTERRARLTLDGQDFIEIHLSDRGYVYVEVAGLEAYGVRIKANYIDPDKHKIECEQEGQWVRVEID